MKGRDNYEVMAYLALAAVSFFVLLEARRLADSKVVSLGPTRSRWK